jgi:nucleoside-diphosphate-sugar epimerase
VAKILMVGGTGNISTAVSEQLLHDGHELHLLCKDDNSELPPALTGAFVAFGDIFNEVETAEYLKGKEFDAVVDWIVMEPADIERDIRLFTGKTKQYIFISSASAYQKPPASYIITERTPLSNPFWEYSRKKIACEQILTEAYKRNSFPATIIRPSLTYGDRLIPYHMGSSKKPWSLIDRIRRGKRVIMPGDGTSLWTVTHSVDFARGLCGLINHPLAVGEDFHITSDEVLTWNDILRQIGDAVGREAMAAHISTEFILSFMPEKAGSLLGDKVNSCVFDNSKLKKFVPDFSARIPFSEGVKRVVDFYDTHPSWQITDDAHEATVDAIIKAHDYGRRLGGSYV